MANNFLFAQLQPFTLAGAGATIGDTTITLKSFTDIDGNFLTMANFGTRGFGTLDAGNGTQEEQIEFTGVVQNANGTATLTGVYHILFLSPYTASSGLTKVHSGSAPFVISNTSGFYNELTSTDNDETILGLYTFAQFPQKSGSTTPTAANELATKSYVDLVAGGIAVTDQVVFSATAGENLTIGQAVYEKVSDGKWYKTDATDSTKSFAVNIGFAQATVLANASVNIAVEGLDKNQSGLTPGSVYYLSNTPGAISATPGTVSSVVGQAKSATAILISPNFNQLLTAQEKAALAGTVGTPSSTNKFVTNDDTTGTGLLVRSSKIKFGGTGVDGALNVVSGTTTIDLANAVRVVKNYTSINVAVGATLAFSNPAPGGTLIIFKSQAAVIIAGTVSASGMGASGGAVASDGTTANALFIIDDSSHNGVGATGDTATTAGGGLTSKGYYLTSVNQLSRKYLAIAPGSGGGGGGSGDTSGGVGGAGGGAIYIECGTTLNFTGTINTSGINGSNGVATGGANISTGGGGGGGSAGQILVLYSTLTANSGTLTSVGGTGGDGGTGGSGGPASANVAGGSGAGSYGGPGGAGAGVNPGTSAGVGGGLGAGGGGGGGFDSNNQRSDGGAGGATMTGLVTINTEFS